MGIFVVLAPALLLALVPMFFGAAKGRFAQGFSWTVASVVVPIVVGFVGWSILAGGVIAGTKGGVVAGVGGWLGLGIVAFVASFVLPALGVNAIATACKREEALANTRARRRRKKTSQRLGARSSGRQRSAEPREPERVPCPECAEAILPAAKTCRFCGSDAVRFVDHKRTTSSGRVRAIDAPLRRKRRR